MCRMPKMQEHFSAASRVLTPFGGAFGGPNRFAICRTVGFSSGLSLRQTQKKTPQCGALFWSGGERGIRTLDTLLTYTPLAGERFRPLSHLSEISRTTLRNS
jgi:hypothetical protein